MVVKGDTSRTDPWAPKGLLFGFAMQKGSIYTGGLSANLERRTLSFKP